MIRKRCRMKKRYLNYLLIFSPLLDFLTSIATWESIFSIGLVVKGIFLIYAIYFLLKYCKNKTIYFLFFILFLYAFLDLGYYCFKDVQVLKTEIVHLIKIYYLPILILYFSNNKMIEKKTIVLLYYEFLILYLLPYPFNLGHNISEVYPNKNLYLSYFYVGNELSNIFVLLLPTVFSYLTLKKDYKLTLLTSVLTLFMLLLLGTKTMYLSVIIILCYFLYLYRKFVFAKIKKYFFIFLPIFFFVISLVILWFPESSLFKNIKTSLEFYEVDSVRELFTFENIDNIIYSNRLDFLKNIHIHYKNSDSMEKIWGLGRSTILSLKDIEIDLFDIFYSVGIIGFIIYLLVFIQILKMVKVKGVFKFTFVLLAIISLFTGHVLISPMTATYLACLFGIEGGQCESLDKESVKKIKNCLHA